jgi:hypothetical protein
MLGPCHTTLLMHRVVGELSSLRLNSNWDRIDVKKCCAKCCSFTPSLWVCSETCACCLCQSTCRITFAAVLFDMIYGTTNNAKFERISWIYWKWYLKHGANWRHATLFSFSQAHRASLKFFSSKTPCKAHPQTLKLPVIPVVAIRRALLVTWYDRLSWEECMVGIQWASSIVVKFGVDSAPQSLRA